MIRHRSRDDVALADDSQTPRPIRLDATAILVWLVMLCGFLEIVVLVVRWGR